ncbi:MAG: hypothetical protein HFG40_03490 [Bacilli bacterium]|nr:hypothetical protein [Bacilli bacterium]
MSKVKRIVPYVAAAGAFIVGICLIKKKVSIKKVTVNDVEPEEIKDSEIKSLEECDRHYIKLR